MYKLRFFALFLVILQFFACLSPAALADSSDFILPDAPEINAASALLLDIDTGTVLYSLNADERVYPASLTKMMTAMLALKYGKLTDVVTVSAAALEGLPWDASTAGLMAGEQLTLEDLLYCVMVASANEACNVVAEYVSGSIPGFVALMNEEAASLGCTGTHFVNTNGLHDDDHYTTARDLSKIALAALEYPEFVTLCNTASKEISQTNLSAPRYLKTTNYLISNNTVVGYLYPRACGVKTGYTDQAGHCLVSTAQNSSLSLLSVITGAESVILSDGTTQIQSFTQTRSLFEYGFSSFSTVTVLAPVDMLAEVPVSLSTQTESVLLSPSDTLRALLPSNYDADRLEKQVRLIAPDGVEAPVTAGDVLGYVTVSYDGRDLGTLPLTAITDVSRSELEYFTATAKVFLANHLVQLALFLVGAALVLYIAIYSLHNMSRRKRRSR